MSQALLTKSGKEGSLWATIGIPTERSSNSLEHCSSSKEEIMDINEFVRVYFDKPEYSLTCILRRSVGIINKPNVKYFKVGPSHLRVERLIEWIEVD